MIARSLINDRSSRVQNRVKAIIWVRPSIAFAFLKSPSFCTRFDLDEERDGKWHHVWYMRHVARGDATRRDATQRNVRLLEAKFSDGMCREVGPDGYAKGSLKGRISGARWQMTNPSRIERKLGGWRRGAKQQRNRRVVTEPVLAECAERIRCCLNFVVYLLAELYTCRCKCYSLPDRWKLSRTGTEVDQGKRREFAGSTEVISVHVGI